MGFNLVKNKKKMIGKCLDFCQVTDAHGFNFEDQSCLHV